MIAAITIEREHGHVHLSACTGETFDGCPVGIVQTGHTLVEALRSLANDLERNPDIEDRTAP